jgi:CheY-like chemotaxis protein
LHHAWDGDEAMAFLRREGIHVNAPRPSIILLDLSMPRMCGRETLALIKIDTMLRAIPVIILLPTPKPMCWFAINSARIAISESLRSGMNLNVS